MAHPNPLTPADLRALEQTNRVTSAARRAQHGILLAVIVVVAVLAILAYGTTPRADAAPRTGGDTMTYGGKAHRVKGEVDVCVLKSDLGKTWTRGLERRANRQHAQRIDVQRRGEDRLGGCDIVVWAGGKVALDYITGEDASNPRYHVYTGVYAMAAGEVNVGTSTPKSKRVATLLRALRDLEAAGVLR